MLANVLLIDAKNALWRSADAFKSLWIEEDGERIPTGAIFGFLTIVTRAKELCAKHDAVTIVCWEGGKLKRRAMYAGYKDRSKGGPTPLDRLQLLESIAVQQKRLRHFLSMLGVPQAYAKGWEADDVMATLAERWKADARIAIFTGDRDLLQCVDTNVVVVRPDKGDFTTETVETVKEKHGVTPSGFVYAKALAGDSSDCIPGVAGIGPKHASRIVATLEAKRPIVSVRALAKRALRSVKLTDRMRDGLSKSAESGELALWHDLSTVRRDVEVQWKKAKPATEKEVIDWLFKLRFRSWLQPSKLRSLVSLGQMQ